MQAKCRPGANQKFQSSPGLTGLLINYQRASTGSVHCLCFAKSPQRPASEGAKQGEEARCSIRFSFGFFSQFQFTALGSHPLSFASLPSFVLLSQSAHNLLSQSAHNLLSQYAQGLRDERELAVREQCFVSTIETKESPSRRCVFPFEYKVYSFKYSSDDGFQNGGQTRMLAVSSSLFIYKDYQW